MNSKEQQEMLKSCSAEGCSVARPATVLSEFAGLAFLPSPSPSLPFLFFLPLPFPSPFQTFGKKNKKKKKKEFSMKLQFLESEHFGQIPILIANATQAVQGAPPSLIQTERCSTSLCVREEGR